MPISYKLNMVVHIHLSSPFYFAKFCITVCPEILVVKNLLLLRTCVSMQKFSAYLENKLFIAVMRPAHACKWHGYVLVSEGSSLGTIWRQRKGSLYFTGRRGRGDTGGTFCICSQHCAQSDRPTDTQ